MGLPNNRAFIATREKDSRALANVDMCDIYIAFKLLSFS